MNIEKAIEQFVECIESGYDNEEMPSKSAIDMALEALEKQESKKPYNENTGLGVREGNDITFPACVYCGMGLDESEKPKYCSNCGQALKWGE